MADVLEFPSEPAEDDWLVGPFTEYRVVVEGRVIPHLTGWREGGEVFLSVDRRFAVAFPESCAKQAAWLLAQALAVGAGYPCFTATDRSAPFTPVAMAVELP